MVEQIAEGENLSEHGRSVVGSRATVGFVVLAGLLAVDFYFDTHERDILSWMDPNQYFDFARSVLEGSRGIREFEVPSIFPLFMIPMLAIDASIPSALWVNFVSMLLLMAAAFALCRELEIRTSAIWVAGLIFSSPLFMGVSRSLYVECSLAALVAWALWSWLRLLRSPSWQSATVFAAALILGTMTKITFPVFVLPLVAVAVAERLVAGRMREARGLLVVSLVPLLLVILIQMTVFSTSFGYYTSLGNTTLPVAYLIGPLEGLSWSGATYYLAEIFRTLLFLLSPFLLIAGWSLFRRRSEFRFAYLSSPHSMLWIQLIAPALLFIVPSVKEPRHLLPCIVPAILLIVLAVEELESSRLRRGLLAVALALGFLQYSAVSTHRMEVPYFLDGPIHLAEIERMLIDASPGRAYETTPRALRSLHWKYNQSIAISGFTANQALALSWWAFPGVVYDLDTLNDPERLSREIPDSRFEDLFLYAAFNTYNRRSGWHRYYETLSAEQVVTNADFLIVRTSETEETLKRFSEHVRFAGFPEGDGEIQLLRRKAGERPHYRTLYGEGFLADHAELPALERRMIARSLVMTAILRGDRARANELIRRYPVLRMREGEDRNIYWIGGYGPLISLADRMLGASSRSTP